MQPSEHITQDELGALLDQGEQTLSEDRLLHLRTCEACGRDLAMHKEAQSQLDGLADGRQPASGPQCSSYEELARLAAGLGSEERRDQLLHHTRDCDSCGAVLRALAEDFTTPLTD